MRYLKNSKVTEYVLMIMILYCQHIQLIYSASVNIRYCLSMDVRLQLLNTAIAAIPFLLLVLITGRKGLSLIVSSIIVTVISLINYHVFLYHGTPFLASDIYNVTTAVTVLSGYKVVFDKMVVRLLAVTAAESVLIVLYYLFRTEQKINQSRKISAGLILADAVMLWLIFFSKWTLYPSSLISWSWAKPMRKYGYEVCFVNSIRTASAKFNMIDGYDAEILKGYLDDRDDEVSLDHYPDIILILNETLCNLEYCSGIPEGAEVLESIDSIPGIISGYTTVPLIGGGTNCSEFELLTSDSVYQISAASPFAALEMAEINNAVKYLKSFGYHTAAMHCFSETGYNRNNAYPAMGFDEVYLGEKHFTYNRNGNREWLDADNYSDMLKICQEAGDDSPEFMYLLTYQNHGGYEQNDASMDTVEVKGNYGQATDDTNEYLSSLKLSAEAFASLISELSASERDTVVLMVGDHAPSFITELPCASHDGIDGSVIQRTVPYYIWSNFDLNQDALTEFSTMTDLMPMMSEAAGIPCSPYFNLLNELRKEVPVRTSDGLYLDQNGNAVKYAEGEKYYGLIRDYYYMEYNGLTHGDDYLEGLFRSQIN
ncbi:MAG: LTA synthase family protein [Erysipelotrichaceae bacterium]|nr:LTA synthase family protein [Erysipelotrichaceae bacterium]